MPLICCCSHRQLARESSLDDAQNTAQARYLPGIPLVGLHPRLVETQKAAGVTESEVQSSLPPPIISHEVVTELDQLVVDDSDTDEARPRTIKKVSGALEAVRTKLIRRISQEAGLKRRPHFSISNSEEEIARRAELKRLMHKRIQDELQTEKSDDACSNRSIHSARYLSTLVEPAAPNVGPRDTIEFVVGSTTSPDPHTTVDTDSASPSQLGEENIEPKQRRGSCPEVALGSGKHRRSVEKVAHGDRSSLPDPAPSPIATLTPPGIPQPRSQRSFQLSNSATRLGRILGPDNGFSSSPGSSSADGQSALGVWLIAQGFRSRDSSMLPSENIERERSIADKESCECQEVDRFVDLRASSEHSPARTTQTSPSRQPGVMNLSGPSGYDYMIESQVGKFASWDSRRDSPGYRETRQASSDENLKRFATAVVLNSPLDNTSSSYPSMLPSFQPSPARSQPNLYSLSMQDLQNCQLSPFDWYGNLSLSRNFGVSEEQSSYTTANDEPAASPTPQPDMKLFRHPTQIVFDAASMSQCETDSFLQRESELQTIEKRFGEALSRKKPPLPMTSRFREEFNGPPLSQSAHTSFMSKFNLNIPKRFKSGSRSQDEAVSISDSSQNVGFALPISKADKSHGREGSSKSKQRSNMSLRGQINPLSSQVYLRPEREESATDMWQRAIRSEAASRRGSNARPLTPKPEDKKSLSSKPSLNLLVLPLKGASTRQSSVSTETALRPSSQLTPKADGLASCDRDSRSKWLIQRWVTQMRPESPGNAEGLDDIGGTAYNKTPAKPPRSWARYPSHTREERTKSATAKDKVKHKDFAIKHVSLEGHIVWTTDKVPAGEVQFPESATRSFSLKLGKAVKTKLTKLILGRRNSPTQERSNSLKGRRGSSQPAGLLEYPELEILPTESGYRELKALEREIGAMKGELPQPATEITETTMMRRRSTKSLGSRISALMYEVAENHHDHDEAESEERIETCPVTPPSGPHNCLGGSVAMTEEFVTPQSRFSFGDMLQQEKAVSDSDSSKSDGPAHLGASRAASNITHSRPRSLTYPCQPLLQLPDTRQLDDFRRELDRILQNKDDSSVESLGRKTTNMDAGHGLVTSDGIVTTVG
ncbi:hypothetical protein G7046_g7001 [Stylonectria norvegica]|nr:hypothetical protein G7046_g7001 [Stylonectria norvegica]